MIWTYVFEFFVRYIFGGVLSVNGNTEYYGGVMGVITAQGNKIPMDTTWDVFQVDGMLWPVGNYFSFIATIVVMALIVWFAIWLTIWVFKLVAHAFLLK